MLTQPGLHRVDDVREAVGTQEEAGGFLVKAWCHSQDSIVQDLQAHNKDVAGREAHPGAPRTARAGPSTSPLPALTCESTEKLATKLSLSRTGCT